MTNSCAVLPSRVVTPEEQPDSDIHVQENLPLFYGQENVVFLQYLASTSLVFQIEQRTNNSRVEVP